MSSSKTRVLAALALLITFVVGVVVGIVGERVMMIRHGGMAHIPPVSMIVSRLDRRLHFTDRQRAQVTEIVQRHQDRIRGIWSGMRPAVRNEVESANSEIDRVLTPEQRAKFASLRMHLMPHRGDDGLRVHHD